MISNNIKNIYSLTLQLFGLGDQCNMNKVQKLEHNTATTVNL